MPEYQSDGKQACGPAMGSMGTASDHEAAGKARYRGPCCSLKGCHCHGPWVLLQHKAGGGSQSPFPDSSPGTHALRLCVQAVIDAPPPRRLLSRCHRVPCHQPALIFSSLGCQTTNHAQACCKLLGKGRSLVVRPGDPAVLPQLHGRWPLTILSTIWSWPWRRQVRQGPRHPSQPLPA